MNYTHGVKKDSEKFQSYMTQNDTKTYKTTRCHTKAYIIKYKGEGFAKRKKGTAPNVRHDFQYFCILIQVLRTNLN